jgi:hypothetical protein
MVSKRDRVVALVQLNLVANITDDYGLAVCRSANFAMEASRYIKIGPVRSQRVAAIRAFLPVTVTRLATVRAFERDGKFNWVVLHGSTLSAYRGIT